MWVGMLGFEPKKLEVTLIVLLVEHFLNYTLILITILITILIIILCLPYVQDQNHWFIEIKKNLQQQKLKKVAVKTTLYD